MRGLVPSLPVGCGKDIFDRETYGPWNTPAPGLVMSHGSLEDYAERAVRDRLRLRLVPLHEALETVLPLAMRSVYRTLAVMIATCV